jgi:hypothetical protein
VLKSFFFFLQFWNKVPTIRVTHTDAWKLYESDSEEVRLEEAKLLPAEQAVAEIEEKKEQQRVFQAQEDERKLALYAKEEAERKAKAKADKADKANRHQEGDVGKPKKKEEQLK